MGKLIVLLAYYKDADICEYIKIATDKSPISLCSIKQIKV